MISDYFRHSIENALRSVIDLKISRHLLNHQMQNQNQSRLGRTRFPALSAGYVYLFRVFIDSLCCLRLLRLDIVQNAIALILVLQHYERLDPNGKTQWLSTINWRLLYYQAIILLGTVCVKPFLLLFYRSGPNAWRHCEKPFRILERYCETTMKPFNYFAGKKENPDRIIIADREYTLSQFG